MHKKQYQQQWQWNKQWFKLPTISTIIIIIIKLVRWGCGWRIRYIVGLMKTSTINEKIKLMLAPESMPSSAKYALEC